MTTDDSLAARCTDVAEAAREALAWLADPANAETAGPGRRAAAQALRRGARRAWRLARAAASPMSVSVFGPSQAGKSFLVSVLARPKGGRLVADFPDPQGRLDYISAINPEGEGESTGLVTRFTMARAPAPAGFPIRLVLLGEADVARTLVNAFFMDGDQSEPPPEPAAIGAHLDALRPRAGAAEVAGMSYEEVFEIAEYVNGAFGRTAYGAALRGFWEEAAALAPLLAPRDRAALFSILWGGHAPLTGLYVQLAEALVRLGHAEAVHVPLAALVPRETSIIDVKTLQGLTAPGGGGDPLAVMLPSGARAELPRAVVCALAAELVMPMLEEPSALFRSTDLLDFPGARNRFKAPLARTLADPATALPQLLLRGKVAYLFDRYVENQDITSMLLCVPDSNMETLDLPGLVEGWIGATHGATPRLREGTDCILFFVLTKFDKHLGDSAASGGDDTRFERRMHASLLEKFGRSKDAWVDNWTPGRPFDNCYWLRNPNYFVDGLIDYDADRREIGIRPDKAARIAELRAGCLAAPSVQRHFADPAAAWDAALALNDGGVSYLLERLTRVCTPDSKRRQIGAQIEALAAALAGEIAPWHVADDIEARIAEKRQMAAAVVDGLDLALRRHRFGAFLAALTVSQDAVQDRIARVPSSVRISGAVQGRAAAAGAGPSAPPAPLRVRPNFAAPPGVARPAAAPAAAMRAEGDIRTLSPDAFQAETAVEVWIEGLRRLRDDGPRIEDFGLTQAAVAALGAELVHALRRSGTVARMRAALAGMNFAHTVDKQAEPAAIVCAEAINRFVMTLGADALPEAERPQVDFGDGRRRPVFVPRPAADSADDLPAEPRAAADELWTDWVFALDAAVVANAMDAAGGAANPEQNLRLGAILGRLAR